jgi:hypothetical protein
MILLAEGAHVLVITPGSGPLTYKTLLIAEKPADEPGNALLIWIKFPNGTPTYQPVPSTNLPFVVVGVPLGINSARNCRMDHLLTPLPLYVAFVVTGLPLLSSHSPKDHRSLLM